MTRLFDPEDLRLEWEGNLGHGLYLLVEDARMQAVTISMDEETETLIGLYPYLDGDGNAIITSINDLAYPVEVLFSDSMR